MKTIVTCEICGKQVITHRESARFCSRKCCELSRRSTPSDFWARVNKDGTEILDTKCWEWTGAKSREFGSVTYQGEHMSAHRLAWRLTNGPIPGKMRRLIHQCGNRLCVNPDHLALQRKETP